MADVTLATLRQRRTRPVNWITLELSAGSAGAASLGSGAATGAGASGNSSGACGSACPMALRMFSQTIGRGSTDPTIWFSTPSRYSQACTSAVSSLSTAIMVSTCVRSSASSVPRAYSAASAIWSSLWAIIQNPGSPRFGSCRCSSAKSKALPDLHYAAAQPCLHRVHRCLELCRQLLAAPAVVIGQQHELLTVRLETANAFQQPL